MAQNDWPEWTMIQLQECVMIGIGPEETAALLGKTMQEVLNKARELDLLFPPFDEKSASTRAA